MHAGILSEFMVSAARAIGGKDPQPKKNYIVVRVVNALVPITTICKSPAGGVRTVVENGRPGRNDPAGGRQSYFPYTKYVTDYKSIAV